MMSEEIFEKKIWYAGEEVNLIFVYNENDEPKWSSEAQRNINSCKKQGINACCLHKGHLHGYYEGERRL